jgi:hypothetical protein
LVYCVGPANLPGAITTVAITPASLSRDDLPEWDRQDISAHLRCTVCGTAGYVDMRLNWSEVINLLVRMMVVARRTLELALHSVSRDNGSIDCFSDRALRVFLTVYEALSGSPEWNWGTNCLKPLYSSVIPYVQLSR